MALQGTIRDFALPDIFQLIGIQQKTGVLTLENDDERVTIKFLDGQVVGADTRSESLEDRLGTLLVRTGRITQAQLREALKEQRNTLRRLGHVLVDRGLITESELVDALNVQSSQIIYRLFRWRDGRYAFQAQDALEYDQKHFVPISSETILMEGARMIDEWPIIERRIRSAKMVLRKTEAALELELDSSALVDDGAPFDLGLADELGSELPSDADPRGEPAGISLSPEEREVLMLVDGARTVGEICDLVSLGEFDVYRILSELFTRNLVEENRHRVEEREAVDRSLARRGLEWAVTAALALLAVTALAALPANPLTPWRAASAGENEARLNLYTSLARMERIERAIRVFYLDAATFPTNLAVLTQRGYLPAGDLEDPWGRPYRYELSGGGYRLAGLDGDGQPSRGLSFTRQFNSVERMMLPGAGADEPGS